MSGGSGTGTPAVAIGAPRFLLVTLDEVRSHLRYPDTDHDSELEMLRRMVSQAVMSHLKFDSVPDLWNEPDGSPSGRGVPDDVKAATLLMCGELDKNKSAALADVFSDTVKFLLQPYRDPTVA